MNPSRGSGGATGAAAGETRGMESWLVGGGVGAMFMAQPTPLPEGEVESAEPTG